MVTALEQLSDEVRVAGLTVHGLLAVSRDDDALADRLISKGVVSFRLEKANAADLAVTLRALGITATPVVVLADGNGRVRYLAPFDSDTGGDEAGRIIALSRQLGEGEPFPVRLP